MVLSGDRNRGRPVCRAWTLWANREASSAGADGPREYACRGVLPRFTEGSSSGAEASSEPSDTRRSSDRGVEEANGTTHVRTPGNSGVRHSYRFSTVEPLLRASNRA